MLNYHLNIKNVSYQARFCLNSVQFLIYFFISLSEKLKHDTDIFSSYIKAALTLNSNPPDNVMLNVLANHLYIQPIMSSRVSVHMMNI